MLKHTNDLLRRLIIGVQAYRGLYFFIHTSAIGGGLLVHILILKFYTKFSGNPPYVEFLMLVGLSGWLLIFWVGANSILADLENKSKFFLFTLFVSFVVGLDATVFWALLSPDTFHVLFVLPRLPLLCTWVHIVPCYSALSLCAVLGGLYETHRIRGLLDEKAQKLAFMRLQSWIKKLFKGALLVTCIFAALAVGVDRWF